MKSLLKYIIIAVWLGDVLDIGIGGYFLDVVYPINGLFWFLFILLIFLFDINSSLLRIKINTDKDE